MEERVGLEPTWGEGKMPSVGVQRMDSGPVRVVGRELMIRFVRGAFHAEQDGSKGHDALASAHAVTTVTEAARQAT